MKRVILTVFTVFAACGIIVAGRQSQPSGHMFNRAPLQPRKYAELPLGSVHPGGWLLQQLEIMRDGMTGNLDSLYSQVMGPRNGWKGGDGDVWERGPYWIDGLLPLAYILDDESLKNKVSEWIEWTLSSQTPDGYFGPAEDRSPERGLQRGKSHDWWPKMVMLKVMQQYYSATGDRRVIDFMTSYFRYQLDNLPKQPLDNWSRWGRFRGGDNLDVVYWLYNITGDEFLVELGDLIYSQCYPWADMFVSGEPFMKQGSLHCVDLAHGFKTPAVYYQASGDERLIDALHQGVRHISTTVGLPTGLWAGDEHVRFGVPTHGSELCTAVEMMYSLEQIVKITGDTYWADYIERVAYNVLPTQITDTGDARQYFQQTNQVAVTRCMRDFTTPHADTDVVFGLLTGYPCCTSNLHQGWTKLVQNLWYATPDGGVAAMVHAPSSVTVVSKNGVNVTLTDNTTYPFEDALHFEITLDGRKKSAAELPFHVRVPEWSRAVTVRVNGVGIPVRVTDGMVALGDKWNDGDKVDVEFEADVVISRWYDGAAVVERGALLYALALDEQWRRCEVEESAKPDLGEYYYEVTTDSPWNYCLLRENIKAEAVGHKFEFVRRASSDDYPWNVANAPVAIRTVGRRIPSWTIYNGNVGPVCYSNKNRLEAASEDECITLIPYGCTTLRIAEFPVR